MNFLESQYQQALLSAQNKLEEFESIPQVEWNNNYYKEKNLFRIEKQVDTHIHLSHFKDLLLDINIHKLCK